MALVFRGLSSHLEVCWSQNTWYQNQFSLPGKKGVTGCCEVLTCRLFRFQRSGIQASKQYCLKAHGSGSLSRLVAVVLICAKGVKLHQCWFVAFMFSCHYLVPVTDSGEWFNVLPDESLCCKAGWHTVNNERDGIWSVCLCLCLQELDEFLPCLHTVLTFCKFDSHAVTPSYSACLYSLLFYCVLTANSFICIPPPYSFTSFSKRLHGDDVRNPFWSSFPFSLLSSFHAFVCSHS